MNDTIMTLHPQGKTGVNISRAKYDAVATAIVDTLAAKGQLSFSQLLEEVREQLEGGFEGSINWYVTTVKLDLEARGIVVRNPKTSPQIVRLAANG